MNTSMNATAISNQPADLLQPRKDLSNAGSPPTTTAAAQQTAPHKNGDTVTLSSKATQLSKTDQAAHPSGPPITSAAEASKVAGEVKLALRGMSANNAAAIYGNAA